MTSRLERFTEQHPRTAEAVLAVALSACTVLGGAVSTSESSPPRTQVTPGIVALVSLAALLRVRSHPRTALAVTTPAAAVLTAVGYLPSPLLLAPVMAALYWLAALGDVPSTAPYGYAAAAVLVATSLSGAPLGDDFMLRTVGTVLWLLLPVSLGVTSRFRGAYLASAQARAAHAERTREEEARLRVAQERMRIARELHDAVAHHMAVANAQAGTAAHLAATQPEKAREILTALVGTTSSALLELRATVGVLRQAGDPDTGSLEPAPGLDRLPDLVAACRSAGLDVTVDTRGRARPLTPGVDLTAYRIVQEALTNATKHASGHAARVGLDYGGTRLRITVTDDGPPLPPVVPAGGYGLMGMRERAHSVGGELHAGPRPEGGFAVTATLPVRPPAGEPVTPETRPETQPATERAGEPRRPGDAPAEPPEEAP
ncbi:sensor histidine kinase [Streptomyces sp. NPDC020983]|uniref:sensor histidine kinase n=1 Tax=Streptomyces sp. NPDC020983 TaxID=3365106 RepID=UPI0037940136